MERSEQVHFEDIYDMVNYAWNNTPAGTNRGFSFENGTLTGTYIPNLSNNRRPLNWDEYQLSHRGATSQPTTITSFYEKPQENKIADKSLLVGEDPTAVAQAIAAAAATYAVEWGAVAVDPEPITKVTGAVVLIGCSAYLIWEHMQGTHTTKDQPFTEPLQSRNQNVNNRNDFNLPPGGALAIAGTYYYIYRLYKNWQKPNVVEPKYPNGVIKRAD